ncbi:MAG: TIGR03435 family protein [Bryobacteraceae bacterium]
MSESGTAASPDSSTIFAALEHQLGLKLESSKRPIKVLVVDHAERPELAKLFAR